MKSGRVVLALVACLAAQSPMPRIHSEAEGKSIEALQQLALNSSTEPQALELALARFQQQFPRSEFQTVIELDAFRYYTSADHFNLAALERHGAALLAGDPDNLSVLAKLGSAMAATSASDPEPEFELAEQYDHRALALADKLDVSPGQTLVVGGRRLDDRQVSALRQGVLGGAQSSLGRIALRRAKYGDAIAAYQTAFLYEIQPQLSIDHYYLALAQEGMGQYDQAEASLAEGLDGNSRSPALTQAIQREQTRIQGLRAH